MLWIQATLLGLVLHSTAASHGHAASQGQTCSTPFQAVFAAVSRVTVLNSQMGPDPDYAFYRQTLGFTDAEVQQEEENAIQHFKTQFGVDFTNVEPNEMGQRILPNATMSFGRILSNFTAIANRWLVSGNTNSKCFNFTGGGFEVDITGDMMLHGVYGGEEGRPVSALDTLHHSYFIMYGVCGKRSIVFTGMSMIPTRILPVEQWLVQELQLYSRWLGTGRSQTVLKFRNTNDPATSQFDLQQVFSFP